MKKIDQKGFTLIELLAVIVILAILMITAIPAVTNSIAKSRKDTFATNAKNIINAVRTSMASGDVKVETTAGSDECSYPATGAKVAVVLTRANLTSLLERGGDKSSFGRAYAETGSNAVKPAGYVVIENSNDKFSYSISLVDAGGNGIAAPIKESAITGSSVKLGNQTLSLLSTGYTLCYINSVSYTHLTLPTNREV